MALSSGHGISLLRVYHVHGGAKVIIFRNGMERV
jgi:hypothetical protein